MNRTITVYDSSTQKKTVFSNVDVNTLGEVKVLLAENSIGYANMDFMEGVSQTKLLNDNSILPNNIPYKGNTTNDLLIYLTLKDKKMRSGIVLKELSRKDIMAHIKNLSLCEEVKKMYRRNYTQVSTENLIELLSQYVDNNADDTVEKIGEIVQEEESKPVDEFREVLNLIAEQFGLAPVQMVALLNAVWNEVAAYIVGEKTQNSEPNNFSDSDIQEMISTLK